MDEASIKKLIRDEVKKNLGFTQRKLTDTPTDGLMYVNRNYVNSNGATASRPTTSVVVVGQKYFDTDINVLVTWDGSSWRNGIGSVA